MRMVMGLDTPTSGSVTVNGRRYHDIAWPMREVGALLEARAIHPGRSARAHLQMRGVPRWRTHPWRHALSGHDTLCATAFAMERDVRAVGGFAHGKLLAVAGWRPLAIGTWFCLVCAVAFGYFRKGYGLAAAEGMASIHSVVHRDNSAMVELNKRFGAVPVLDPHDPRKEHFLCEVPVPAVET